MPDRKNVISNLQVMHTWASFASERKEVDFFTEAHLQNMAAWTMDALELLEKQEERIEQLEHDLAFTQNILNYYVNGND